MNSPGLGKLQVAVLMAVATLDDEAYGLGVRQEVSEVRGREYSVGAIYTTLSRPERGGRPGVSTNSPPPGAPRSGRHGVRRLTCCAPASLHTTPPLRPIPRSREGR